MSVHFERGFVYDMEKENMGSTGDIGHLIKTMKWARFYMQPNPYNVQLVKEFYANLVDTTNKRLEVKVCRVKVSYSKATINMVLGLGNFDNTYQNLLETSDDQDYDIYVESLCNLSTKSIDTGGEKMVRIMDLHPESKVEVEEKSEKNKGKKKSKKNVFFGPDSTSGFGVPKYDSAEKPKKKARKDKKPNEGVDC
ncbi:hypothetical protein RYX36_033788 [Vicia faba]